MNITCEACRERWDELFNDSQPETAQISELAQVRAHLAQCAQCRNEFALLKAARQELHTFPALAAPLDLRARIRQQLEAEAASAAAPEPVMSVEEVARHKAQIENKILEGGEAWRETPAQRLKNLWLRFQKSLRHPATMALSSGAALLLICFVSLNTLQTVQVPPESAPQVANREPETADQRLSEEGQRAGGQVREPRTAATRKVTPAAPDAAASRPFVQSKKNYSAPTNPTIANGTQTPALRSNAPATGKAPPPVPSVAKPHSQVEKASPPPVPATPAPVKALPAMPRDENAGNAAAKVQPAPLPAAGAQAASPNTASQTASPPAAMMARESQDMAADTAQANGAGERAGAPQAAMAQRAPELRAVPEKPSSPKRYLARRRSAPERIEASITAPRHIGNAEIVVELPEEAQFTDGSRSRVLWRGTVRKDESIAVKFEAEVEPEAEDARVVLKENKDGATETVAYKDVPVSDTGRRRSR